MLAQPHTLLYPSICWTLQVIEPKDGSLVTGNGVAPVDSQGEVVEAGNEEDLDTVACPRQEPQLCCNDIPIVSWKAFVRSSRKTSVSKEQDLTKEDRTQDGGVGLGLYQESSGSTATPNPM
ncbi:unnamed protein product [Dovyalis caffra]|uniref:Uncharacterized protein n=1 Tax=Dovyalis caffra TaxID=77055 RepID=A0AAV1RKT8_9ROSI|nr:unnamed protein product [Dovyalis caffra]